MKEKFAELSEEEQAEKKAQFRGARRERWSSLSVEERAEKRAQIKERFGSLSEEE